MAISPPTTAQMTHNQQRERVYLCMGGFHQRDRVLDPKHQRGLRDGKQGDPSFVVSEAFIYDEQHQQDLDDLHAMIEQLGPCIQAPDIAVIEHPQRDDGGHTGQDEGNGDIDDEAPCLFISGSL